MYGVAYYRRYQEREKAGAAPGAAPPPSSKTQLMRGAARRTQDAAPAPLPVQHDERDHGAGSASSAALKPRRRSRAAVRTCCGSCSTTRWPRRSRCAASSSTSGCTCRSSSCGSPTGCGSRSTPDPAILDAAVPPHEPAADRPRNARAPTGIGGERGRRHEIRLTASRVADDLVVEVTDERARPVARAIGPGAASAWTNTRARGLHPALRRPRLAVDRQRGCVRARW